MSKARVMANTPISEFKLSAPLPTKGGGRIAPITDQGNTAITIKPGTDLRAPYGASTWGGEPSNRLNLDLSIPTGSPEEAYLKSLDDWAIDAAWEIRRELFKKDLSREQVAGLLKPCLSYSTKFEGYYPTLRTKLSTEGARKTRCWNADKQPVQAECVDFQSCELTPILAVKGLWCQSNSFGFVFNVTDIMCREQPKECPF